MTKQRMARMALVLGLIFSLSACGSARAASGPQTGPGTQTAETAAKTADTEMTSPAGTTEEVQKTMLQMKIGETKVSVSWEDNDSVAALKELCKDAPLTIQMSFPKSF